MFCFLLSASGTGIKEGSPVCECEAVWIFFVFRVTKNLAYSQCEDFSTSKCVIILLICNGYFNSFTQWEIFYLWYYTSLHYIFHTQQSSNSKFWIKQWRRFRAGRQMCREVGLLGKEWNKCSPIKRNCGRKISPRRNHLDDEALKNWWSEGEDLGMDFFF